MPSPTADTARGALLAARQLAGRRGDRMLFQGLDLTLDPADVVWLRGRNGRGKTTLLRLLAGLGTPADGCIESGPQARDTNSEGPRAQVYIAHANALKEDLSAVEALRFLATLGGAPAALEEAVQALKRLGVASRAHAPVRTLSQGQRRRVALARLVLSAHAPVWLLDEPYDALDHRGVQTLDTLITDHAAQGGAVLLTSHQAVSIPGLTPRVLDLDTFAPAT